MTFSIGCTPRCDRLLDKCRRHAVCGENSGTAVHWECIYARFTLSGARQEPNIVKNLFSLTASAWGKVYVTSWWLKKHFQQTVSMNRDCVDKIIRAWRHRGVEKIISIEQCVHFAAKKYNTMQLAISNNIPGCPYHERGRDAS